MNTTKMELYESKTNDIVQHTYVLNNTINNLNIIECCLKLYFSELRT